MEHFSILRDIIDLFKGLCFSLMTMSPRFLAYTISVYDNAYTPPVISCIQTSIYLTISHQFCTQRLIPASLNFGNLITTRQMIL
jgi:hypothetical protein